MFYAVDKITLRVLGKFNDDSHQFPHQFYVEDKRDIHDIYHYKLIDGVLVNTFNLKTYVELRREAYPAIESQLDDIFHLGVEGWKAKILAIKTQFPKPEEVK